MSALPAVSLPSTVALPASRFVISAFVALTVPSVSISPAVRVPPTVALFVISALPAVSLPSIVAFPAVSSLSTDTLCASTVFVFTSPAVSFPPTVALPSITALPACNGPSVCKFPAVKPPTTCVLPDTFRSPSTLVCFKFVLPVTAKSPPTVMPSWLTVTVVFPVRSVKVTPFKSAITELPPPCISALLLLTAIMALP